MSCFQRVVALHQHIPISNFKRCVIEIGMTCIYEKHRVVIYILLASITAREGPRVCSRPSLSMTISSEINRPSRRWYHSKVSLKSLIKSTTWPRRLIRHSGTTKQRSPRRCFLTPSLKSERPASGRSGLSAILATTSTAKPLGSVSRTMSPPRGNAFASTGAPSMAATALVQLQTLRRNLR